MPQLDAMSLAELNALSLRLRLLTAVGATLQDNGLTPIFGMVPGESATIVLPPVMPPVWGGFGTAVMDAASLPSALNQAADDAPPAAVPDAAGVDAPGDVLPSEPDHMPTSSREDVRTDSAAVPGAEAPVPPADLNQPVEKARAWTPEEDARLVQWVAEKIRAGSSKAAAICVVAADLDRPEQGAAFRLKHKLKDALAAALAEPIAVPEQTSTQVGDGNPVGGGAGFGSTAQAPADTPAGPIVYIAEGSENALSAHLHRDVQVLSTAHHLPQNGHGVVPTAGDNTMAEHLAANAARDGWTLAEDEQLMALANQGWGIPEIATDMGRDAQQVRNRWDSLTGLYKAEDGKQARRFKAKDVAAHLTLLMAGRG